MTIFLRLLEAENKAVALREAVSGKDPRVFDVEPKTFEKVPGSPFAYWVSRKTLSIFQSLPPLESGKVCARVTNPAGDDKRYFRTAWEIKTNHQNKKTETTQKWVPLCKGGKYEPFYSDIHLVVAWDSKINSYHGFLGTEHRPLVKPASLDFFFRPGLTWPRRTQSGLALRAMPAGCIFADKGPAVFVEGDAPNDLLAILAISNSATFRYLVELQMAFGSYEVGVIQRTPIPDVTKGNYEVLIRIVRRAWSLKRALDTITETSHAFLLPSNLRPRLDGFDSVSFRKELEKLQVEIDDRVFRLYGIEGKDRVEIEVWAGKGKSTSSIETGESEEESDEEDESISASDYDGLLSWCVGVAFGRFDIRLATGERDVPPEPEPFDFLPGKSPGMLPDGDLPYRPGIGILVDDLGHAEDLTASVKAVLERVITPVPEHLHTWLACDFFSLHIKMYSKSRRKAPIYWQLATPTASYSVWIYIHAFNKDTLYRVQNDFASLKLRHEERKLESMRSEAGESPGPSERTSLARQESFVDELRTFLEEVKRVAPLWNPNLDDGVVINFAPLWRLVPQNRTWQKELKSTWDDLCAGEFDWSNIAMHLWPERVVPKCAEDRSLAIAHNLESLFWAEEAGGKWKRREVETKTVDDLIRERTSPSVKAALQSLLEASTAGTTGRIRKTKIGKGAAQNAPSA